MHSTREKHYQPIWNKSRNFFFLQLKKSSVFFILVDNIVNTIYGKNIATYFASNGVEAKICPVPGGDVNKNEEHMKKTNFKEPLVDVFCIKNGEKID